MFFNLANIHEICSYYLEKLLQPFQTLPKQIKTNI